ncbi:3'-5' exonuclease [Comamonas sp. 26]|uniref:3'-5' exonuclease n=1 Tax=Comamonas sp. 26 TaxID=2035201 RepID=UPI000C177709|nr:3'-5' exonuclease [Comamonas sp. 26]PIG08473.1 3'-5' exonuclease [Comamonas sp. 26]
MHRLIAPNKDESALLPQFLELPEQAIHIPQTEAEFEAAFRAINAEPVLGFDTESKPLFNVGQHDSGPHLVQLATTQQAWLLQLHLPMALELSRKVLAAEHICKVGFGLDNDKHTLPRRLGVPLVNIQDLDSRFKQLGYGASVGVRAAAALVLQQSFRKSKRTTTSNWAAVDLTPAQRRYAANDAHAPAVIYAHMTAWESTVPVQPQRRRHNPQA